MAKRVTCNEAVGRHLELLKAEAHLELPPGGGRSTRATGP